MKRRIKGPGTLQLLAILCATIAALFVVSFAEKAIQARQLLEWRGELQDEIAQLEREKINLQIELARRQQPEWYDEVLRDAGYISEGDVRVVVVTQAMDSVPQATADHLVSETVPVDAARQGWFANDNWRAWQSLLWGS